MSEQSIPTRLPSPSRICACGCGQPIRSPKPSARYRSGHRARSQFGTPEQRFWANVKKQEGCWLWQGAPGGSGYGELQAVGRNVRAHRFSWELHFGPIPEGLWVLHRCDQPLCVNPAHLFLGTTADNSADRDSKGRQACGERHGMAKLKEAEVHEIKRRRSGGETLASIAAAFQVSPDMVCNIARGKNWRHLRRDGP